MHSRAVSLLWLVFTTAGQGSHDNERHLQDILSCYWEPSKYRRETVSEEALISS